MVQTFGENGELIATSFEVGGEGSAPEGGSCHGYDYG